MWFVEFDPEAGLLTLRLTAQVASAHVRRLARVHQRAIAATANTPFSVLADLRGLAPLDRDAANLFTDLKRSSAELAGFRRRAILIDSPTIALQQKRTSIESDTTDNEIITSDVAEALAYLRSANG